MLAHLNGSATKFLLATKERKKEMTRSAYAKSKELISLVDEVIVHILCPDPTGRFEKEYQLSPGLLKDLAFFIPLLSDLIKVKSKASNKGKVNPKHKRSTKLNPRPTLSSRIETNPELFFYRYMELRGVFEIFGCLLLNPFLAHSKYPQQYVTMEFGILQKLLKMNQSKSGAENVNEPSKAWKKIFGHEHYAFKSEQKQLFFHDIQNDSLVFVLLAQVSSQTNMS